MSGLTFEPTRPMGGRTDKNKLVKSLHVLGKTSAKVSEGRNYAIKKTERKALSCWTLYDNLITLRDYFKSQQSSEFVDNDNDGNEDEMYCDDNTDNHRNDDKSSSKKMNEQTQFNPKKQSNRVCDFLEASKKLWNSHDAVEIHK